MRCEQILPYLPGYAGGDLRAETMRIVEDHVAACRSCAAEADVQRRVVGSLATLAEREVRAPAFMMDAILETVKERHTRRVLPLMPLPVGDIARVVSDHREAIASAAGTVLVAAGAAYALWRALRTSRATQQPATS